MKKTIVLLLAIAVMSFTAQAQTGQGKVNRGEPKEGRGAKVRVHHIGENGFMIPDLNEEQRNEIKKLRLDMAKESTSIRNQMAEKRARLNTLQSEDKADMNAINKTIDEIASLQAQQMKAKANFRVKVRALLNDEQKVAFDQHRYSTGKGMGQMRMRDFSFDDFNFKEFGDFETLGELTDFDFGSIVHHFEFDQED